MADKNISEDEAKKKIENEKNFKFASSFIKVIAVVIAIMVLVISRFAFIFFSSAMLPTIFAVFLDRNDHKCLSATICSFNLIGVMPFLIKIWESNAIDYASKQILADITTWMTIYGAAFIGQLIYISLPLLIVRIYATKVRMNVEKLEKQHKKICDEWEIEIKNY